MTSSSDLSLLFADSKGHPVVFAIPEGTTTLGSADDNDLVLVNDTVSAHQVVIMRDGDALSLQDLFAGETRVNEEIRMNGTLGTGDVLRLGEVKLRIMRVAARRQTASLPRARGTTRRLRLTGQRSLLDDPVEPVASDPTSAEPPTRVARSQPKEREATPAKVQVDEPRSAPPPAPPAQPEQELLQAQEHDARRARALARSRQLSDELMTQDDFEEILERIAESFLDVFSAERSVTVLFEEDGRNPLMTIERQRAGTDDGAGVAQEIIDRCLQVRSVIRVSGGLSGLAGLAAPIIAQGSRALGLLYFERLVEENPLDADDVHLMALLTNTISLVLAPLVD